MRWEIHEFTAKAQEPGLAAQNQAVDQPKGRLHELNAKGNQLVARSRTAAAGEQSVD